ncbi:MAG: restriction endonuclease subunit S [Mongoliitalea sp.]
MMEEKLPKGWSSNSLKDLLSFVIGGDWGKDPNDISDEDYIPVAVIRGSEIKNWRKDKGSTASIRVIKQNSLKKRNLIEGDILIEISGGGPDQPVGRVILIDEDTLSQNSDLPKIGTNFLRLLRANQKLINASFLNYYLSFFYITGKIVEYQGGSNNLRNLKYKEFEKIQIPYPSLPEQQRIVAKLDTLFGHLDWVREKLDWIPALLKNFRQQVLTQAVTGELTKEKMKIVPLGEYLEDIKYGTSKKSEYKVEGVPILRIPNIDVDKGVISISNMKYSKLDEKEYEKLKLREGDILIIRSNGSVSLVGQSAIIQEKEIDFAYAGYLVRLRSVDDLLPKFLNYILKSNFLRSQIVETSRSTSGVNNINTTEIKSLRIPLTSVENQRAIIDRIEMLFNLADKIESKYASLKAKIDQLPQAILAKAFRGELVEQEVKRYEVVEREGLMAAEGKERYGIE